MDAKGAEAARPWLEKAGATYHSAVDRENRLAHLYGIKAVLNCWLVDERGLIRYQAIRRSEIAEGLSWLLQVPSSAGVGLAGAAPNVEADAFQEGARLLREGRRREAVERWLAALEADPDNLLIRKQVWYVLHPERFSPEIDSAWQREQMAREKEQGFREANLLPEGW